MLQPPIQHEERPVLLLQRPRPRRGRKAADAWADRGRCLHPEQSSCFHKAWASDLALYKQYLVQAAKALAVWAEADIGRIIWAKAAGSQPAPRAAAQQGGETRSRAPGVTARAGGQPPGCGTQPPRPRNPPAAVAPLVAPLELPRSQKSDRRLIFEARALEKELVGERERLADGVRSGDEYGRRLEVCGSLREAMRSAQLADEGLQPLLHRCRQARAPVHEGGRTYRAVDGWPLETAVALEGTREARWVAVVPRGGPQPGQTWKAFFCVAEHVAAKTPTISISTEDQMRELRPSRAQKT